jgi:hypothetical protein
VEELTEAGITNVICGSAWEEVGSGLVGAFALALDILEHNKPSAKTQDTSRKSFSSGIVAGICLSLSALLVSTLVRRR